MTSAERPDDTRATRSDLLPEENSAGSDNPDAQAEEILKASAERTAHSEAAESSQSRKNTSDQAT